jgi:hypothetical protein
MWFEAADADSRPANFASALLSTNNLQETFRQAGKPDLD